MPDIRVAPIALASALAHRARADMLYVSEYNGSIVRYDTASGASSTFVGPGELNAGLAIDAAGDVFAARPLTGEVVEYSRSGAARVVATGLDGPRGLALDPSGNLFVANFGAGTITRITPGGMASTFATGLKFPNELATDRAGDVYVDGPGGTVSRYTPGGSPSVYASGLFAPQGVAVDPSGNLYASDAGFGTIIKVIPGRVSSVFASGFVDPTSLAADSRGGRRRDRTGLVAWSASANSRGGPIMIRHSGRCTATEASPPRRGPDLGTARQVRNHRGMPDPSAIVAGACRAA